MPGGLIGPTIFIGAVAGSIVGIIVETLYPQSVLDPGLYAMIGMGAMMAATIQAPLAALMAIFELTHQPSLVLPGLIAIAFATLTSSEILKQPSVFITLMGLRKNKKPEKTITANTQLITVINIVDKHFARLPHLADKRQLSSCLESNMRWVLVENNHEAVLAFRMSALQAINFSQVETVEMLAFKSFGYSVIKIPASSFIRDISAQVNSLKPHTVFVVYDDSEESESPPILGILHPKELKQFHS